MGSGIRDPSTWSRVFVIKPLFLFFFPFLITEKKKKRAQTLTSLEKKFPHLRHMDLGGGLAITEHPQQSELDVEQVASMIQTFRTSFEAQLGRKLDFWIEPGRYFVAKSCVLLANVTQIKTKDDFHYVGL